MPFVMLLASKVHNHNYVHLIINYAEKCPCSGLSALHYVFVAMAVADGLLQHNY